MSRCWKAALPFLLAAVIILAAASRPVVLHIGFRVTAIGMFRARTTIPLLTPPLKSLRQSTPT